MAIIKCPECGHQVSDKAPTCPSCGVEIAGKVVRCHQCGAIYFSEHDACPICSYPNTRQKRENTANVTPPPIPPTKKPAENEAPQPKPEKKSHYGILFFSMLMAAVTCGTLFYFYHTAKDTKEAEAYNYAITSEDPLVLQSFLDTYRDANSDRRDSVEARLLAIQQASRDWAEACASRSKTTIQKYLEKYPNSAHKGEALNKIDSIDWAKAKELNSEQGYEQYLKEHPSGAHVDDADEGIKNLRMKYLQPEENTMLQSLIRRFFQNANARNDEAMKTDLADVLLQFQGEKNVPAAKVASYMHRATWRVMGDYKIEKKPTETDEAEYAMKFTVVQEGEAETQKNPSKYFVETKVNSEGLIVELNLSRVVE